MAEMIIIGLKTAGLSGAMAGTVVNLGGSLLLSAASQALLAKSQGADLSRELSLPNSLPPYRFVYGRGSRIRGSWVPGWVVNNGVLYGCILLNSRPSAGTNTQLNIDARPVGLTGDLYDFGDLETGTATIAEGATFVDVTHGLADTPTAASIAAWSDDEVATISSVGATTFRATIASPAPVGGVTLNWTAMLYVEGARATNYPFTDHLNVWMGRGDQMPPPTRILSEVGDLTGIDTSKFWPTDRWAGRTVLWVRMVAGGNETRLERWPTSPPAIEVDSDWSRVWDPRDELQDPEDPATWLVSDNQALCLLDAVLSNPISRYRRDQVILDQFIAGADLADEAVALKAGGTEARYRVGGIIVFSRASELQDQLAPLTSAGAGSLLRVGGNLGYLPGSHSAPDITITDYLRDRPLTFRATQRTRDHPSAIQAKFPDKAAQWESSDLVPIGVADDWDGSADGVKSVPLGMVFSATQAMRIQQIMAREYGFQKTLDGVFPPSAILAIAGSVATVALPRLGDARNATYRVTGTDPTAWLDGGGGVAFAVPMTMTQTDASIYAWDPETDEQDRFVQVFVPIDLSMPAPVSFTAVVSGYQINLDIGSPGTLQTDPNILFTPSSDVAEFDWQFRRDQTFWQSGAAVPIAAVGLIGLNIGHASTGLSPLQSGSSYDLRVRSKNEGRVSEWLYVRAVQYEFVLGVPTSVTATPAAGQITIEADAPSDVSFAALQVWGNDVDDVEAAYLVEEIAGAPSDTLSTIETGLGGGVTRYYFVRGVTSTGAVGPWAATLSATTP